MPATKTYKTPGVYVAELAAFPPSVVGVATAIPAFIGYTQKAEIAGKPVINKPIPISSLAAFEEVFGGGYKAIYNLEEVPPPGSSVGAAQVDGAPHTPADDYDFKVWRPSPPDWIYYRLTAKKPTGSGYTMLQGTARALEPEPVPDQPRFNLYNSMRLFYANGGGDCFVVSVGTYEDNNVDGVQAGPLIAGLDAVAEQVGPTMLVVPDAVALPSTKPETPWVSTNFDGVAKTMLKQAAALQDRVAILDVYGSQYVDTIEYPRSLGLVIDQFRTGIGEEGLSYGMAYFPFLDTSVIPLSDVNYTSIDDSTGQLTDILTWENQNLYGGTPREGLVQDDINRMGDPDADVTKLNQNLVAALPLLKDIEVQVVQMNDMLPPSAAMAGVFSRVDSSKGVWNAPANVTLNQVEKPTTKLNGKQQEDLNMPVNGKAIDALRVFPGRGTVVWGARTLDGNSPDYRYIQVRRTLIYIEQSVKAALNQFVFAANTGQTWATVVSMVSGFLQNLWSQGGLMGATAQEAFSVECGVGSTMTGTDILNGYMIVQVTLQLIRPAEFIELTFKQKMDGVS
jgi:hypothetical protein